ncbi:MAG TPA: thioredoxin domain-containing protein [Solirubrobacteraceae bacterium]|nr:thioredoxin domain-containing protein [Solirubrobacteraceae bacterium]
MASRTKQKEEARARRLAEERARAERARRQRRLQMVGGTVVGAIVVVVVLVLISSGGAKKETGLQTGTTANSTMTSINQLLGGIPQSGNVLGNPKAPVTMTYYGDYECPVCQAFTLEGGLSQLVSNDVRAGKVKVEYRSFCTATCGSPDPGVFNTQQVAGLAAGKQNLFWQYTELFYHEQGQEDSGYVTPAYLNGLARQIPNLDYAAWQTARNDPNLTAQVSNDQASARQLGVSGTPTLIFSGPKGEAAASEAVPTYAQLEQVIKQVT